MSILMEEPYNKKIEQDFNLIQQACERYNKKHNINLSLSRKCEVNIGDNEGVIVKSDGLYHFAGYYRIKDKETGIPYYIIFDTYPQFFTERYDIKKQLFKQNGNRCRFINIGMGLQTDGCSCMVFALKGIEQLAKNEGKIAEKILQYVKNKYEFRTEQRVPEVFFAIDKDPEKLFSYCNNLADIPYAGEFIKLAQSAGIQNKYSSLHCYQKWNSLSRPRPAGRGFLRQKIKRTVGDYFNSHKQYNDVEQKYQSNKINKLYDKIMLNNAKCNEKG